MALKDVQIYVFLMSIPNKEQKKRSTLLCLSSSIIAASIYLLNIAVIRFFLVLSVMAI